MHALQQQRGSLGLAGFRNRATSEVGALVQCRASRSRPRTSIHAQASSSAPADIAQKLRGIKVLTATDGQEVELLQQWGPSEKVLVTWTRSLGCPFCQELAIQLRRDVQPKLEALGMKLIMVSIGTHERSKDFVARTGFPPERLFLDPDNVTYDAIGLKRNVQDTFFNIATPLSLLKRATEGKAGDLANVLNGWQPWLTPKGPYQALQQGGMFVFEGDRLMFSHFDEATGSHADLEQVLALAQSLAQSTKDCGCDVAAV